MQQPSMSLPASAWRRIPELWRIVTVAVAIGALGWSARDLLARSVGISGRVHRVEQSVETLEKQQAGIEDEIRGLRSTVERTLCYAEVQAGVRHVTECLR